LGLFIGTIFGLVFINIEMLIGLAVVGGFIVFGTRR